MTDKKWPRKVVISPNFGAGWSTWNETNPGVAQFLAEHPLLIEAIENNATVTNGNCHTDDSDPLMFSPDLQCIVTEAKEKFDLPDDWEPCLLGIDGKRATVVTVNGPYRINEYDGSESIEEQGAGSFYD